MNYSFGWQHINFIPSGVRKVGYAYDLIGEYIEQLFNGEPGYYIVYYAIDGDPDYMDYAIYHVINDMWSQWVSDYFHGLYDVAIYGVGKIDEVRGVIE